MIDANRAVGAHAPIEPSPRGQVFIVCCSCVLFKLLERLPVLPDENDATGNQGPRLSYESQTSVTLQLDKHSWHRHEHWQPFPDLPHAIDPHADEKEHGAIGTHVGGESSLVDLRHARILTRTLLLM